MKKTLVSTVVVPSFATGIVRVRRLTLEEFSSQLPEVTANLLGHPATNAVLKQLCPSLPDPVRGFWDGVGKALAARPRGGVRGASATGDTVVSINDLEFCEFVWEPE